MKSVEIEGFPPWQYIPFSFTRIIAFLVRISNKYFTMLLILFIGKLGYSYIAREPMCQYLALYRIYLYKTIA